MKKINSLLAISSMLFLICSCGGGAGKLSSKTKELNTVLEKHSEFKEASLKAVHNAATGSGDSELIADPSQSRDNTPKLDSKTAKEVTKQRTG